MSAKVVDTLEIILLVQRIGCVGGSILSTEEIIKCTQNNNMHNYCTPYKALYVVSRAGATSMATMTMAVPLFATSLSLVVKKILRIMIIEDIKGLKLSKNLLSY